MAAFFCPYCFLYETFQNSVELEWHVLKKHGERSLVSLLKSWNRTPGCELFSNIFQLVVRKDAFLLAIGFVFNFVLTGWNYISF